MDSGHTDVKLVECAVAIQPEYARFTLWDYDPQGVGIPELMMMVTVVVVVPTALLWV